MNIENLIRPSLLTMNPYVSARHEIKGDEHTYLDANEFPDGDWNRYPDPYQAELREKIAREKGVNTENVFLGNGSDEVLDLLFRVFCTPGKDRALQFTPTYGMYRVLAQLNDVELSSIPLTTSGDLPLDPSLENYLNNSQFKLIFVCSPNNPLGTLVKRNELIRLLECSPGLVVVDEAYIDFASAESVINLLEEFPNLVVVQTMSKAWASAGLRIGMAYPQSEVIEWLNKLKPPYNNSGPKAQLAIQKLSENRHQSAIKEVVQRRRLLRSALAKLACIKFIYPSETNFLLIKSAKATEIKIFLGERKIIIRDRSSDVKNTLRISVGTEEECNRLVKLIQQFENEESTVYRS